MDPRRQRSRDRDRSPPRRRPRLGSDDEVTGSSPPDHRRRTNDDERNHQQSDRPNRRERSNSSPQPHRRHSDRPTRSQSPSYFVCIRNLPVDTMLYRLQSAVIEYVGKFVFVHMLKRPGASSMLALVEFDDESLISKCVRRMDELRFGDRTVDVLPVEDAEAFMQKYTSNGYVSCSNVSPPPRSNRNRSREDDRGDIVNDWSRSGPSHASDAARSSVVSKRYVHPSSNSAHAAVNDGQSSKSDWIFSGDIDDTDWNIHPARSRSDQSRPDQNSHDEQPPDEQADRVAALEKKLLNSVWKTRLGKKINATQNATSEAPIATTVTTIARSAGSSGSDEQRPATTVSNNSSSSNNDAAVSQVAVEIMTGAFHIRRALEMMRKSDASYDAFLSSAMYLRQFNDELSDWRDMYFSREPDAVAAHSSRSTTVASIMNEEREKCRNLVEVKRDWGIDDTIVIDDDLATTVFSPPSPSAIQNTAVKLSFGDIDKIQTPIDASSWFMIGPAQPRFSTLAAIRRGALNPLIEITREKTKQVLSQLGHIVSPLALSRCIRAISVGGYVDLGWLGLAHPAPAAGCRAAATLGDCGLSYSSWYRCFELVIKVAEIIGAPTEYSTSLTAYKRLIGMWWLSVASVAADKRGGNSALLWLPFYELFDKSWRVYAARSPEYRAQLHIFDAWWVLHHLEPIAARMRVPTPPYDRKTSVYLRQVAAHYEEMVRKLETVSVLMGGGGEEMEAAAAAAATSSGGVGGCSVCGDFDHKSVEMGRVMQMFCPFASRRIPWCLDMYEGLCDSEICVREGKHACVHCGNPGRVVKSCPNCKCLVE